MKTTIVKMALATLVLFGVAAVSYQAGAAKAKQAVQMAATEIKWEPLMGGPLQMAKLWGDRDKGPEYGMLLKFPAGTDSGMHAHTGDYHAVSLQGTWVHTVEGEAGPGKELPPGSYVFQPGKQMHDDLCKGKQECIVFVHQHAKGDFIPSKKPADKAAAPPAAPAAAKPAAPAPATAPAVAPAAPGAPAKK
jgi:quercetin dioxygenase-like cupin family protein